MFQKRKKQISACKKILGIQIFKNEIHIFILGVQFGIAVTALDLSVFIDQKQFIGCIVLFINAGNLCFWYGKLYISEHSSGIDIIERANVGEDFYLFMSVVQVSFHTNPPDRRKSRITEIHLT